MFYQLAESVKVNVDGLVISVTKLDDSFSTTSVLMDTVYLV